MDFGACCHRDGDRGTSALHVAAVHDAVGVAEQLVAAGCPLDGLDAGVRDIYISHWLKQGSEGGGRLKKGPPPLHTMIWFIRASLIMGACLNTHAVSTFSTHADFADSNIFAQGMPMGSKVLQVYVQVAYARSCKDLNCSFARDTSVFLQESCTS